MDDDDELPIPSFIDRPAYPFRKRVGTSPEDTDIWARLEGDKLPRFGVPSRAVSAWWADTQDAAIMLALTELKDIRPDRKRLALFLKYAG